ncbi:MULTISPECIES: efflux RND transporter periplasmic adaptor subunit [Methylococcus]|uniref:Efflux RND transporter periplasmic adaptor subunit n=1 Tax=Methylococcus capsulatus TaxID=414 RepID=A0ABZ2F4S2_METCP|nr:MULTISPECIES: efflux RND transporter periplasmic adaptor subunit [Methylococcus]MDF9392023.1 biotin/lipoyl-binding protein [Methylococcus capsulatus]
MLPKATLPVLAVAGFLFGVYSVVTGNQPLPVAPAVVEPARPPFESYIAGAGIVEARSRNIGIGTPLPGLVKSVEVKVGDRVEAGAVLFRLDDREPLAELEVRWADLLKARAGVAEAEASLTDANTLLALAEAVTDERAISAEEVKRRRNAVLIAKARLETAHAQVRQAEAQVAAVQTTLDRMVVRAPIQGEILQVNVRIGEYATTGFLSMPLVIMGDLERLHVRVDIDENDAWRFHKGGKAYGYLRGNSQLGTELKLAYVEPYIVPKRSLTGDSTERVDTRVLQVVYSFDPAALPVFVGQQLDVFIEAPEYTGSTPSPEAGAPEYPAAFH